MGFVGAFNGVHLDDFYVVYHSQSVSLQTALDCSSLSFSTGGGANWFGQTGISYDGVDAAQSGDISDGGTSWMETTVDGPATVSFKWRISSECNYDYLRFYVDGSEQFNNCGEDNFWTTKAVAIGSGSHTLKWAYTKNGSVSDGEDCGWVDQIVVTRDDVPRTGRTWYVDGTTGSDSYSGTSSDQAKKTIQAAIDVSSPEDTIYVVPGTYNERLEISRKILLWGVGGPEVTTIRGIAGQAVVHIAQGAVDSTIRGFAITGGTGRPSSSSYGYDYYGGGVCADASAAIQDCIIHGNGHGMPRTNSGTFGGGIRSADGYVRVINCLFYDNFAWACGGATFVEGTGSVMELDHCTIYGNESTDFFGYQGGVGMANGGSVVIRNSIVWGNGGDEIDAIPARPLGLCVVAWRAACFRTMLLHSRSEMATFPEPLALSMPRTVIIGLQLIRLALMRGIIRM